MDLQGADIHEFLSCLGRHAITKATFRFPASKYVEPSSSKIVFVEDTGEFAQAGDNGFGVAADKEETETTPGGWGRDGAHKEDNARWNTESNNQETSEPSNSGWGNEQKNEPMPPNTGWGMETNNEDRKETMESDAGWTAPENPPPKQGGWSDEQVVGNDGGGWDSVGKREADKTSDEGEAWGSQHVAAGNDWDRTKSKNREEQNLSKEAFAHPSRRDGADTTDGSADDRRSGKFGPSGTNMVPLGKRRYGTKPGLSQDVPRNTNVKDTQFSHDRKEQTGWGVLKETATADSFGWNDGLQKEDVGGDEREIWGNQSSASQTDQILINDGDAGGGDWNSAPEGGVLAGWGDVSKSEQGKDIDQGQEGEWGKMPAFGTKQEMENGSAEDGGWSSQPDNAMASSGAHGWGLGTGIDNNGGWNDMQSDEQAAPAVAKVRKVPQTSWGFREPSERDGGPLPRKKINRGPLTEGSWGSNSSQSQSRRSRVRALLNLPEYSELDELYKATNMILHHSDYQPGDKLKPEDETFILAKILVHHPDKEAKLGCGVDHVMIDSHAEHQVSCFWVVRKDGSKADFSYWKCLEGLLGTKYANVASKDSEKEEVKESWKMGVSFTAHTKEYNKPQDGWTTWSSSIMPTTRMGDQEEAKDSRITAVGESLPDAGSWDMGATSEATIKTATIDHQQGAEVDTFNEIQAQEKGGWDTWVASEDPTTNACNEEVAKNSGWE